MNPTVAKQRLCRGYRHFARAGARGGPRPLARSYSAVSHDRPFRLAVIGSGPAGFYTAYRVKSRIQNTKVDMYEALPVPFGLVRFGVAPDHPEVKNCRDKFEEVASSPDFTFVGNVSIAQPSGHADGNTLELGSVLRHYDAVVFAYGASLDKTLGIPGESSLRGIYSARAFVGWYNGLPEFAGLGPDLAAGENAVVVGQGNVALDIARMLLEDIDVLRKTDIADHALAELARSRVKSVTVVGRRGPMQAAFTIKEARELMKLQDVGFHSFDRSLIPGDLKSLPRAPRRLMEVLLKGSAQAPSETPKSWGLDFCLSPTEFIASGSAPEKVGTTRFERTSLSDPFDPKAHAQGTGEYETLPSDMVFRSIGYKSEPLPGFGELGIPFDERRGIIQNDGLGRVSRKVRTADGALGSGHFPGLYCAGWVKRGPTGVIASTMEDAFTTGDAIAGDWLSKKSFLNGEQASARAGWEGVSSEARSDVVRAVTWQDWKTIDEAERERGKLKGKEREKFPATSDMLAALR